MSKGSSSSSFLQNRCFISNSLTSSTTNCRYLGFILKQTLSSRMLTPLWGDSGNSGLVCTRRHYVPRQHLIGFYKSNVNPIIQYVTLVCGCSNRTSSNSITTLREKHLRMIYSTTKRDHCEDLFVSIGILTVYDKRFMNC